MEIHEGDFIISDQKELLQIDRICAMLKGSYWASERKREEIEQSIKNSLCFGVYCAGEQVGFARCVTDYATIYWLCDVIIDDRFRGLGLGKALIGFVQSHESIKHLSGILATRDAHGLYARHGFAVVEEGRYMRKQAK